MHIFLLKKSEGEQKEKNRFKSKNPLNKRKNKNKNTKMAYKNLKHSIFLIKHASIEIGLITLFFLLPYIALAAPITKEIIINLTNKERSANNLQILNENKILDNVANNKAKDILEKQYFAHTNPDGKPFYKWVEEGGYNYNYAGENLAIDFDESEEILNAWMGSPAHRDNIINNNYTEIGIGIASGTFENHPSTIVVQIFGQPFITVTKLDNYSNLEEQTFKPLINGSSEKKAIINLPKSKEIKLNDTSSENQIYIEPRYAQIVSKELVVSSTPDVEKTEGKKTITPLIYNTDNTPDLKSFVPSFDVFLFVILSIIIISIYGSIMEKIKASFVLQSKKRHFNY